MNARDTRPPADFLERAKGLLRAMHGNAIDVLPDGTTVDQLETLIQQSLDVVNEVDEITDTLKGKQDERDGISKTIWKVVKGGAALIESRFGDDALQLEQVGRKRRSKYARSSRKVGRQTASPDGTPRKSRASRAQLNTTLPAITAIAHTNGTHASTPFE